MPRRSSEITKSFGNDTSAHSLFSLPKSHGPLVASLSSSSALLIADWSSSAFIRAWDRWAVWCRCLALKRPARWVFHSLALSSGVHVVAQALFFWDRLAAVGAAQDLRV